MIPRQKSPQYAYRNEASIWSTHQDDFANEVSIRSLLVPVDGTLLGEHAIPYAVAIARRTGAVVHLVHVHSRLDDVEPWQMSLSMATIERRLDRKNAYLRDLAERLRRASDILVNTMLIDDHSAEKALADAAGGFDLVVMSSRRPGLLQRIWAPSVATRIGRAMSCPTLVVRGAPTPVDFSASSLPRNILLPLDGSVRSARILAPALALATESGAALTLLNVQNETWSSGHFEHDTPSGYLLGTAKTVTRKVPVTAHVLTTEVRTADAISDFAKECGADLIAVATSGGNALSRLWRGSVADALLRKSNLPILVLGPRQTEAVPRVLSVFP